MLLAVVLWLLTACVAFLVLEFVVCAHLSVLTLGLRVSQRPVPVPIQKYKENNDIR